MGVRMRFVNVGILAHVDAGKTSLTEYLLYRAGVIRTLGQVDKGTTQTDTMALERERGITIKAAVATFVHDGVTVNLIDTPGHPDFIAEVERALSVLDAAVLVVSAVEGMEVQTRLLLTALERLELPTFVFLNKIDRPGARPEEVADRLREFSAAPIVVLGRVQAAGARSARFIPTALSDRGLQDDVVAAAGKDGDDDLVARYLDEPAGLPDEEVAGALALLVRTRRVLPVYAGSAMTGAGVDELMDGLCRLGAPAPDRSGEPFSAQVFKLTHGGRGPRAAYIRVRSGSLGLRDRVVFGAGRETKVSALEVIEGGSAVRAPVAVAGQIALVYGLAGVRIGDSLGTAATPSRAASFGPPTLESGVRPVHGRDGPKLYRALSELAIEDPLLSLARDGDRDQILVSFYGEVQREVLHEVLHRDYGVEAVFSPARVLNAERPLGTGRAVETMGMPDNPFAASLGIRVDRDEALAGIAFQREVELGSLPLAFHEAVEEVVHETLAQGLYGWPLTGARVTLMHCAYNSVGSTAADFRHLTRLLVMLALSRAGTEVMEPWHQVWCDVPEGETASLLRLLAAHHGLIESVERRGPRAYVAAMMALEELGRMRRELSGKTHGAGLLTDQLKELRPVHGAPPVRERRGPDPRDRKGYLMWVRRVRE